LWLDIEGMKMKYLNVCLIGITIFILGCGQKPDFQEFGNAKPFELYDTDSVSHTLENYRGKLVLIHFWADWCTHCRQEFPKIQKAYEKLKPQGFEILAVNAGQSRKHVLEIKISFNLTFPLLVDEEAETAEIYGVTGLPTSFFVDGEGKIREKHIGWLEEEKILEIFKKLHEESYVITIIPLTLERKSSKFSH
jgi:peroxiredoxin